MKKRRYTGKRKEALEEECFQICLHQRCEDTYGRRLKTYFPEELMAMSREEREKIKADGWLVLPNLITPHAPIAFFKDRVEECPCNGCEAARQDWRGRTGRV